MQIKTCTGQLIELGDHPDIRAGLVAAAASGADLRQADLRQADLDEADLDEADLDEADLHEADLHGAKLRRSNLSRANLRQADLRRVDLRQADLRRVGLRQADLRQAYLGEADLGEADLGEADLGEADLSRSNLRQADLRQADLRAANFSGADLRGAVGLPDAPVLPQIDAAILARIESGEGTLDMSHYHSCLTTHCRAGWAIVLAGEPGADLERQYGPSVAAALIYHASRPGRPVPDFYCTTAEALADLRLCAEAANGAS